MRTVEVITPQNVAINYKLASLGSRILAYLMDAVFIGIFYVFLFFLVFVPFRDAFSDVGLLLIIYPVVFFASFYHLLMEQFNNGQSLGKYAMSIRVINENGSTPGFMQLFMRWLLRLVDISISSGGIAILSIAITEKGQRLGDLLGRTIVIDLHKPQTTTLADQPLRKSRPTPQPNLRPVGKAEPASSPGRLENNLRANEPEPAINNVNTKSDASGNEDIGELKQSKPEINHQIKYPEVANLTETDIRKLDTLYTKVRNGDYDIQVQREMLTRMKIALEKKMGVFSREDTITAFLKQIFADFHAHQKEQEDRGGW